MKAIIATLLSIAVMVGSIKAADDEQSNKFKQQAKYWEGLDGDEEPYEHDFVDIPDLIDNKTVLFYFNLTH